MDSYVAGQPTAEQVLEEVRLEPPGSERAVVLALMVVADVLGAMQPALVEMASSLGRIEDRLSDIDGGVRR